MNETKTSLVSICVPTYNSELTLHETLASIINQTYKNLEILIVDNASSDDSLAVARRFVDPRISIHESEVNLGAEGNFNRCISLARGEFVAIYHADDIYTREMVSKQVDFLQRHPNVGCVFTEAEVINQFGDITGCIALPHEMRNQSEVSIGFTPLIKALLRHFNFLLCPSAMVRAAVYRGEIKGWRGELFRSSADLDVWLRIARDYKVGILLERLMKYRVSDRQYSANVRIQTGPADFFLVAAYYLKQADVRSSLASGDFVNYERLLRRDLVMRAANMVIIGEFSAASNLLQGFFTFKVLIDSLGDKRSALAVALALYLKIINNKFFRRRGQRALLHIKQVLQK
jgi:glycosyltransferase involved in cell wall biosynthesis